MLGSYVLSDLHIPELQLPTQLSWGQEEFQRVLQSPTSDIPTLKQRQLALFAFRHKTAAEQCTIIRNHLASMHTTTTIVDEIGSEQDPRILELVEQIYWNPTSFGAFLNHAPRIISVMVFWKTMLLPIVAVLVPLLAIVLPFFLLRYIHGVSLSAAEYMSHFRGILLKQITIPDILRAKHQGDVLGHVFETAFLGLTAFTYISSIWSQVTAALHLRTIAQGIQEKGVAIRGMLEGFVGILDTVRSLPDRLQKALRPLCLRGEQILADLAEIPRDCGYRVYGYVWNHRTSLATLKAWLGELDTLLAIAGLPNITFPTYTGHLHIEGLYHPSLEQRVSNTVSWSKLHAILTGPNRGGKSTLCKAVGVSLLCAQSWGYAYAERMSFVPFQQIVTALHPADQLGSMSLFEAEIEFAKDVLRRGRSEKGIFVMMDEIFHSTNARDGLAASRVFLSQLYALPGVTSLISTHYKELPAEYAEQVHGWAMDAMEKDGRLHYSYKLITGISEKSSVLEILEERGLITRESSTPSSRGLP